jgi:hypothetical protein
LLGTQSTGAQSALDGGYTRSHGRLQTSVENPNLKYLFGVLRARRAAMPPRRRAT